MVNADLSKNRWCDKVFLRDVEEFGLDEALEIWERRDRRETFQSGLLALRLEGMTYKAISGMTNLSPKEVSSMLKPLIAAYDKRCHANIEKLNKVLVCPDPEYMFMVDKRIVLQEMCALLIGGSEIRETLEQLSNLGESK